MEFRILGTYFQIMHMNINSLANSAQYFNQIRASAIKYTLVTEQVKYYPITTREHFNQEASSTMQFETLTNQLRSSNVKFRLCLLATLEICDQMSYSKTLSNFQHRFSKFITFTCENQKKTTKM